MKKELIHFEQLLAKEREMVISELKGISVNTGAKGEDDWEATPSDMGNERADANDVADKIESYEGNDALVRDLEIRLREIDYAANKMKAGKYGICEVCNEEIEEERLEANPAARTCKKHLNEKLAVPEL
jgi:RNA polymerase-binding transcription factor DksA